MDLRLTYTNHRGESIGIGGSGIRHLMETDAFDHAWGWEAVGSGIVTGIRPREILLPIGMLGGTLAERTRSFGVLEADAASGRLGELSFNGYILRCCPVASALGAWWFEDGIEERGVTMVAPVPLWCRETVHEFPAIAAPSDVWLDFEYDLPIDTMRSGIGRSMAVASIGPARWKWVVYGPAVDPYVIIGGNRHEVDVTVPAGSRLELDTRSRTIMVISRSGGRESVFGNRLRGGAGSGTYAFEPLPRGLIGISADDALSFDIVVYDERMEPAWD